ncbi:DNA-binding anti-repressor SinI [Oceanobacillus profundus]|uniref:DNA-binding anti-repressor SinI n=1 Tax=Oceanobacillus profundus TaxID=372463 RepID=A0A417YA19_9BACI|nr:DNA-binding anti-repressor SinI [Oceanobacillus profundus]
MEIVAFDQEWITLIKSAKKLGISLEEVQQFLNSASKKI